MARVLIIYSAIIIMVDIIFIAFIGQSEKVDKTEVDSLDRRFSRAAPFIYNHLDIWGFRIFVEPGQTPSIE